jgi:hypothetical protein
MDNQWYNDVSRILQTVVNEHEDYREWETVSYCFFCGREDGAISNEDKNHEYDCIVPIAYKLIRNL